MAGNADHFETLKNLAHQQITAGHFPYVSLLLKDDVVIAIGTNQLLQSFDESTHCDVVAIRRAQAALETGRLEGYRLFSLFEPTILSFDLALFAGIRHFSWCLSRQDLPQLYSVIPYGPLEYQAANLKENLIIEPSLFHDEAVLLLNQALEKNLSTLTD